MPQDPITYAKARERLSRTRDTAHGGRVRRGGRSRGEPFDWSADERHPAGGPGEVASRGSDGSALLSFGVAFAIFAAIRFIHEVFAALGWISGLPLGCTIASLSLAGGLVLRNEKCQARVGRRRNVVIAALGAMFVGGGLLAILGAHEDLRAVSTAVSATPHPPRPLLAMPDLSLPSAPGTTDLVIVGGDVWEWGGRRLTGPAGRPSIRVPARIDAVEPCGGGMLVAFGSGSAIRYSPRTGKPLGSAVDLSSEPLAIECGGGSAFLGLRDQGVVLRTSTADLAAPRSWIPIGGAIGGLLVRSDVTLLVGDVTNRRVAHVSLAHDVVDHYIDGLPEPMRLLPAPLGAVSIASNLGCLRTVSSASAEADRPGLNVPGRIVGAAQHGDSVLALANGGYWMQRIDLATMTPGPLVPLPNGQAATAVVATSAGWIVQVAEENRRLLISSRRFAELEAAARSRAKIRVGGPCV